MAKTADLKENATEMGPETKGNNSMVHFTNF